MEKCTWKIPWKIYIVSIWRLKIIQFNIDGQDGHRLNHYIDSTSQNPTWRQLPRNSGSRDVTPPRPNMPNMSRISIYGITQIGNKRLKRRRQTCKVCLFDQIMFKGKRSWSWKFFVSNLQIFLACTQKMDMKTTNKLTKSEREKWTKPQNNIIWMNKIMKK